MLDLIRRTVAAGRGQGFERPFGLIEVVGATDRGHDIQGERLIMDLLDLRTIQVAPQQVGVLGVAGDVRPDQDNQPADVEPDDEEYGRGHT